MLELITKAHPILTVLLLILYGTLGVLLQRRKDENALGPWVFPLAQFARISLLLTYLTGLIMSMNLNLTVSSWHHIISLVPVVILFGFQILPNLLKKEITAKMYALMFISMGLTVLIIALSSQFN